MELPRFQVGELFKIIFWAILIAVPIGLYYLYYSDMQSRYDNQRNFRALSEVSGQFELHLQALEKLFLFVPPEIEEIIEEKRVNAIKLYKRRLQTSDFLQGLEVREARLTEMENTCLDLNSKNFILDTQTTQANLEIFPCDKIPRKILQCVKDYGGKKTRKLSECLKKVKNPKDLEIHQWLEKIKNAENSKQIPNPLKELKTFYFKLPLGSLLGSHLPLEFDEILLSNDEGQVLFQKGFEALDWAEKKTSLKTAGHRNNIANISWLLQEATEQLEVKNHNQEKDDSSDENVERIIEKLVTDHKDAELEHSTYIDLEIAGIEYRVYIHPFIIAHKIYKGNAVEETPEDQSFSKLYVLGVVEKDRLGGSVLSLPFIYFALALLFLLLGFLSWPFLKLNFMGVREAISINDLHILLLSLLFGLVVITVFLLTIFTFYGMENRLDKQAKNIAFNIEQAFNDDLSGVLKTLIEKKTLYTDVNGANSQLEQCQDLDGKEYLLRGKSIAWKKGPYKNIFSCLNNSRQNNQSVFPPLRDIFALDSQGKQYGPIIYFVERLYSSKRLGVGFRDYFKKPRDGKTWHWQDENKASLNQPFFVERIYNFSDGNKASQVAIPIQKKYKNSIASMTEGSPVVLASTTYFSSIAASVLPASFHFAIIENASGDILYHSEDEKSFVENLYAESDHNHHLITHAQMKHEGQVEGLYHGNATKFFVLPLNRLPWSIVVYYDLSRLHVFMVKTAVVTLFSFILYLIPVLFLFLMFTKMVVKNWDWLWPHHRKLTQYTEVVGILALFSLCYSFYILLMSGWYLYFSLILAVPLILGMVWLFVGDNPLSNKYYHPVFWVCCFILIFSLFPQLIAAQEYEGEVSLYGLRWPTSFRQLLNLLPPIGVILSLVIPLFYPQLFIHCLSGKKQLIPLIYKSYCIFLLSFLIFLVLLLLWRSYQHPTSNWWYSQVSAIVILVILLLKYIFFRERSANYSTLINSRCPLHCRAKYLGGITLVYLSMGIIPTIGLFKDTFSVNQSNYARINQMRFADSMQQRMLTLDRFSRMFYPSRFDKPNHTKTRLTITGNENEISGTSNTQQFGRGIFSISNAPNEKGIYGFDTTGVDPNNKFALSNDERTFKSAPTNYFLNYLKNINLQFAQHHVIRSDTLNKTGWAWIEEKLIFTTEDSAGVQNYQITIPKPTLGSIIQTDWHTEDWVRISILLLIIGFIWWQLLTYFSRRVFGIFIPEPLQNRNSLLDQQVEADVNPFNMLIRGASKKFLIYLNSSGITFDAENDIEYLDMLTTNFSESIEDKKIYIIDNLDAGIQEPEKRKQTLAYLEKLVYKKHDSAYFVFIRCEISPLYRLTNPQAYPYVHMPDNSMSPKPDMEEIYRWSKVLAKFKKHYCWKPSLEDINIKDLVDPDLSDKQKALILLVRTECRLWPEMDAIEKDLELILLEDSSGSLNEQQVLEYIRTHANVFYRNRWELCTRDERLSLCQLATEKFINPANEDVIEHLYRRGYIKRAPYFRIANQTFKRFIANAELLENPHDWEIEAAKSVWASLKIPLFIILFCLTGVLLYVASDTLDVTLGLLSGLLAFIPLLLRSANVIKGGGSADIEVPSE